MNAEFRRARETKLLRRSRRHFILVPAVLSISFQSHRRRPDTRTSSMRDALLLKGRTKTDRSLDISRVSSTSY